MITINTDGEPVSQEFADAMAGDSVSYSMRLFLGGSDLGAVIKRARLDLGAGSGCGGLETFEPGQVYGTQLEASLADVPAPILGEELEVRVGVDVGGTYEYVTVAWATVVEESSWRGVTDIRAVGRMGLMHAPIGLAEGDYAPSSIAAAVEAATGIALAVDSRLTLQDVHVDAGCTCRDALESMCARLGAYACELGEGVAVMPYASASTATLPAGHVTGRPELGAAYTVDGITVESGTGELVQGTGRVHIADATATAATAAITWGNMRGYSFTPAELDVALIDPRWTPADTLAVTLGGEAYSIPARGISITYDGGYFGTVGAVGMPAEAEGTLVEGPLSSKVAGAERLAHEAEAVSKAVNQHFWHRSTDAGDGAGTGAFVTDEEQDSFLAAIAAGIEPTPERPLHNLLMNAEGILIRAAKFIRGAFLPSGVAFYDGSGNDASNVVAAFGKDGSRVGGADSSRVEMDPSGFSAFDRGGAKAFEVRMDGAVTPAEMNRSVATKPRGFDVRLPTIGGYSRNVGAVSMDISDLSSGLPIIDYSWNDMNCSRVEFSVYFERFNRYGSFGPPIGQNARYVPMREPLPSGADSAMKIDLGGAGLSGSVTSRLSYEFHPTSGSTLFFTDALVVEAVSTYDGTSVGISATVSVSEELSDYIAEMIETVGVFPTIGFEYMRVVLDVHYDASTYAPSLTFGTSSGWRGDYSSTHGVDLIAAGDLQTVLGRANVADEDGEYALIIGNGTDDSNRSNAMTVDWSGDLWMAGEVEDGSGNVLSDKADASDVYTQAQTDALLSAKADVSSLATVATTGDYADLANTPTIDSAIDATSANAVENMAIAAALADKADASALADYLPLTGGTLSGNIGAANLSSYSGDLDALFTAGVYHAANAATNKPVPRFGILLVSQTSTASTVTQLFADGQRGTLYIRYYSGGTWSAWTLIASAPATEAVTLSGATAENAKAVKSGNQVTIYLDRMNLDAALANGSSVSIGTLPSGMAPSHRVGFAMNTTTAANASGVWLFISASGAMTVYNRSGASIATSAKFYLTPSYGIE